MSDGIILNLGQGEGGGDRQPVPEGTYTVRCINMEHRLNKAKTGMTLETTWRIEDEGDVQGKQLRSWHSTTSQHEFPRTQLREMLFALTGEDWSQDGMTLNMKSMFGLVCKAVVIQEPAYDDPKKIVNKIDTFFPAEDADSYSTMSL